MAKRLICGLLALAMLVTLFLILASHLLGWRFEAILSGSMNPALKTGDLVVVSPVDSDAIRPGDIIGYHPPIDPDSLMVHRVSQVEQGNPPSFQTKGDANPSPDAYLVSSDNVVGRVRLHLPWVGHFTRFAQNRLGLIFLLVIPGTIIIAYELAKLRKPVVRKGPKPATNGPIAKSLARPMNSTPPPANSPSGGLEITAGSLRKRPLAARTDTETELVSLGYGGVPQGNSRLSGDKSTFNNLMQTTSRITATINGEISRYCRNLRLTVVSWRIDNG